jgi:hypothetical protein
MLLNPDFKIVSTTNVGGAIFQTSQNINKEHIQINQDATLRVVTLWVKNLASLPPARDG